MFSMMTISSLSILAVGEEHPDDRSSVQDVIQLYRSCCVQSLLLSNFTKPGPHTIETLFLHMEGLFVLNKDNPVHFYLLTGNTVRLALRMGLHRDPSKVRSNITVFQAVSMNRYLFSFLICLLTSCQTRKIGLRIDLEVVIFSLTFKLWELR